ncbi:phosphotransferase family protein [Pontixanthobacter luteolus]|uniref:phosphotransferase family protein n=1 Tax=Pontixanthobacter luteolus TaxID=295089 RepID=UPI002302B7E2|nr:phosphotransferase [Pontixanthobacter luteolus]
MNDKTISQEELKAGIERALARTGRGQSDNLKRLTGGATMESWRFEAEGEAFVLRRAPSLAFMDGRPFGHECEAAIIRSAHAAGVTAPEVLTVLEAADGIGSGFIMRALPGTPDPRAILAMEQPDRILGEVARDLARIHSIGRADLPADVPVMDYAEGVESLRLQFEEAGGDRPIIALGLRWLADNVPAAIEPVLNHGDYRLGNILCEDSHLTGVLDWELAHFGDPHEDLAFGCMPVWRFARYDRPALGLGSLEDYFAAYEVESGRKVDPARFRFWSVYRTVWWALGCIRMADFWRRGEDRMLERVVISRRTSEQELDLLMLLEEDAPEEERAKPVRFEPSEFHHGKGEATLSELLQAINEWLGSMKGKVEGHDKFQLAVARNALGMAIREEAELPGHFESKSVAREITSGERSLQTPGMLGWLRHSALEKLSVDVPKYPALAAARKKWTGEE